MSVFWATWVRFCHKYIYNVFPLLSLLFFSLFFFLSLFCFLSFVDFLVVIQLFGRKLKQLIIFIPLCVCVYQCTA